MRDIVQVLASPPPPSRLPQPLALLRDRWRAGTVQYSTVQYSVTMSPVCRWTSCSEPRPCWSSPSSSPSTWTCSSYSNYYRTSCTLRNWKFWIFLLLWHGGAVSVVASRKKYYSPFHNPKDLCNATTIQDGGRDLQTLRHLIKWCDADTI